jgi:hypothetical protein
MPAFNYANSHYAYIEKHGAWFSEQLVVDDINSILVAHGDKSRQYEDIFKTLNVSSNKGAMVYLLSFLKPYSNEVRDTNHGWISVESWLIFALTQKPEILATLKKLPD